MLTANQIAFNERISTDPYGLPCHHELGIPINSRFGMQLILRLGQQDCPRCLRRERDYWKACARQAEGRFAVLRRLMTTIKQKDWNESWARVSAVVGNLKKSKKGDTK